MKVSLNWDNGKKLDLSKFNKSKDVSQLSFDKNKDTLTIISNNHDPYITYKDSLNISNSFTINYTIKNTIHGFYKKTS